MTLTLEGPAFEAGATIPRKYTCDGADVSPPLDWHGVPDGTVSLMLICDDPDAPSGVFHHWIVYNTPPDATGMLEGIGSDSFSDGVRQAVNDFGKPGYGGACPPEGDAAHAHHFRLSALNARIDSAAPVARWSEIDALARPLVIEEAEFVGFYGR